ncbi:hypothetical protein [Neobacillus ginsengisoli]|uniref:Uncharacterized protein n=1 Tax=Neobacillus ginsengisoli TaxID=904295 RepID=A0ABT9XQV1_9BACI|nr:hypothetical protein [Neobacillus ginsengisoli]MDQ0197932.1 hypothetical protein [Neobacillus ginsengisoli]
MKLPRVATNRKLITSTAIINHNISAFNSLLEQHVQYGYLHS